MSRVIAAFAQFFKGDGSPLANGYLRFLISQTTSTEKATYADVDQTIPNANPVQLDGEGRCPNVFGQGIYKVILYAVNPVTGLPGAMIQTFDPVVADYETEGAGGNFAEWQTGIIYQIGQIVIYNGLYYRSHVANNVGNQPDTSPDVWERIAFLRFWNLDVTYGLDDIAVYNSQLYFSLQAANLNHQPDISPTWWDPVGSGTILLNWQESGTSFIPVVSGYAIGNSTNRIGDLYQSSNAYHYFGDSQQASIYHDGTDLYIEETSGELIIGTETPSTGVITFKTAGVNKWSIAAQGRLIPENNKVYDIGSASRNIMDFFQGDNCHHYFGDAQDVDLFFDSTDFNIKIGSNIWKLLSSGHLQPQTDATFDIGDASHRVKRVFISDEASTDYESVNLATLNSTIEIVSQVKDYVQNGFQLVWQRDTSQTTAGIDSDDRVVNDHVTSTKTHSRQAFTVGQTDVPGNPLFYSRTVVTTGGTSGSLCNKSYKIMGVEKLSGQTVLLTFWGKADSTKNIATEIIQNFGTGGSASVTGIGVTTQPLTSIWQRFDTVISIPSISGKTVGTNDALQINFWFDAGSDFDSRTNSLGNQSGTFDIHGVRLLNSPYFVDLPIKNFEETLIDCLPYYEKSWDYETAVGTATNQGTQSFHARSGTAQYLTGNYKASKVVTPSLVIYSPVTGAAGYIRNQSTLTDILINSISNQSKNSHGIFTLASAQTAGEALYYHFTADTGF